VEVTLLDSFYTLILGLVLIAAVVGVHFQALRIMSVWHQDGHASGHAKVLLIIFGLIAAHVSEAGIFALGFWLGEHLLHLGAFTGNRLMDVRDFFYFSLETYTTQGVGDIYPVGALRLIASLEPVAGLILIGWSTSFTFLVMGRDWTERPVRRR